MASFDETFDSLRHRFEEDKQPISPVTLGAISKNGSIHYVKGFGKESDNAGSNGVHWLASCTKLVTIIAVMQCVEKCQLSLNDDIAKVLPEWKDPKILTGFNEKNEAIFRPVAKAITLRQAIIYVWHLLAHSSGMAYVFMDPLMTRYQELQALQAEKFPQHFLVFEPDEQWMYSPGIDWAGVLVERITFMKLGEYMQRHLFDVIYQGVLTGKLLRSESVKEMFQPHLETPKGLDNPAEYSLSSRNAIWNTVPDDVPVSFGIGGLINTTAVPKRRGVNSLTWSGLPNCYWWIDLNNGVAGMYLSQLIPSGDEKAIELLTKFEEFVYSSLDKS
ncbi:beta-lactamase/transpeptidase-like protein [Bimuria novae-zelandiae CBS 107.79]|uniref:Beta-lactamase/transpeptidase-like protein n=1 Tax=Bimuria novae-zelandiae CBS 107.79 TaxID=1447943 RepID=A0A6A5UVP1_9PLEO|nr:beta-lactamase/transpeptidase-like protein [Bimuria novae-zelandiae CBS 107.79]